MKNSITYPDFEKLDIRVGTVVSATLPDWSRKLIEMTVDFGEDLGLRTIFSGIRQWYQPEDVLEKQFAFLVNLEPKKMGESESQGMMLMADASEQPVLTPIVTSVPNGTIIR